MNWASGKDLIDELAGISLANVFNPYRDRCQLHDLPNAPAIRRSNMETIMDAGLAAGADELWVGLELGAKGGRRTGLPLTDEVNLQTCGEYWSSPALARATSGAPVKEETARFVWKAMNGRAGRVFFWNAFPFHTHGPDGIKNRGHTPAEFACMPPILPWLVDALGVERIVALGRPAERALSRMRMPSRYVRHPGRGGGELFLKSI
ncbi:uracil-DNA glycosylase [Novosphingobium sp. Gsoil 351]|uniref:uracil-DNA glycosylase n=1 Tax=Novosphingobium sp. Gsoil 351 TaxID=2675225 RepID=UPI0012B4E53A|nr:uracil-DNA glycosylase [Novosphingobium sp. Gsoil 351]QGN55917.1 uracil-DNA glycosylase [Novosphingobium sp. Gsoil 351]